MTEIIFLVEDDPEGGYVARAMGESIFTQADSIEELREMVKDAVRCHYDDEANRPKIIRLSNSLRIELDWEQWDKQIQEDSLSGKLDFLIEEALMEKAQNKLQEL